MNPINQCFNLLCTVTLTGANGEEFKGFFVQARMVADDSTRVGSFEVIDDTNSRLSSCPIDTVRLVDLLYSYSETSNNGLSERRTTSLQRTNSTHAPIALPIDRVSNRKYEGMQNHSAAAFSSRTHLGKLQITL